MYMYRCVALIVHWKGFGQTGNTPALFPGHVLHFRFHHTYQCALHSCGVTARVFTPLGFSPGVCSLCLRCYLCHLRHKYLMGIYDTVLGSD